MCLGLFPFEFVSGLSRTSGPVAGLVAGKVPDNNPDNNHVARAWASMWRKNKARGKQNDCNACIKKKVNKANEERNKGAKQSAAICTMGQVFVPYISY